ncbi:small integral membrane protein 20-like [Liolophura sinensis]|uniref:small integral membrane protein 20-like n=1 Tax=Liolophura sinensis TaxID=3198878 RepID=UPI003158EAC3
MSNSCCKFDLIDPIFPRLSFSAHSVGYIRPMCMVPGLWTVEMVLMKGWRYGLFITGVVGTIGVALYPIIIDPYLNPKKWQDIQKTAREGIDREKIQPGGMKVWSDPFDRKK